MADDPARAPRPWWVVALVVAAYAAVVVVTSAHHEPWRDEVVPLSIARESPTLGDVWRMMRHEGHPILWYLVLRWTYAIFHTTLVLPIASAAFAIAAVAVLTRWTPIPLPFVCLLVSGYFPLYEYSVVARANALAMLAVFAFCAAYRAGRPIVAAAALAALANSTALGFLIAAAAGVLVAIEAIVARDVRWSPHRVVATALWALALAHAVASNAPDPSVSVLPVYRHDVGTIATQLTRAVADPLGSAEDFYGVPFSYVWLWLWFVLLLRRPGVLAFTLLSLVGFRLLFSLVYPANERHLGYALIAVVAAWWLWYPWDPPAPAASGALPRLGRALRRVLLVPLVVVLLQQTALAARMVRDDVRFDYSSSARLGALLASDPRLGSAIVIGEPETMAEALPYYRDNRVFLPQEHAFRHWLYVQVPGGRRGDYDLGELLATATTLRAEHGVPVVIVLAWSLDGDDVQWKYYGSFFTQRFTMSAATRAEFRAHTERLASFQGARFTDENYNVFLLQ